ncbi:RsmB/NOP family class I SAM-dependent RNA methyltransferase [Bacillaceae bacterium]
MTDMTDMFETGLPQDFLERMRRVLPAEAYEAFLRSLAQPRTYGLRVNELKISAEAFLNLSPFPLEPVPWTKSGFYYREEDQPGKHPYHEAGLYYIQEPSAMAVVERLRPEPGEKVLDLCAAPGGKATQIAAAMQNTGLLVANEIHPVRVKALVENLERCGVTHAVITNETPDQLAQHFPRFFDKILVDAPCSGEGMFRKNPQAVADWSPGKIAQCAALQQEILVHAARMLRVGGRIVYSTCTFAREENEETVARFLSAHPEFRLLHEERLWPHEVRGEGHFIALLEKTKETDGSDSSLSRKKQPSPKRKRSGETSAIRQVIARFRAFCEENLQVDDPWWTSLVDSRFLLFGNRLYLTPEYEISFAGLKISRPGWHLGVWRKDRFEPGHALAIALKGKNFRRTVDFAPGDEELNRYLHGESLPVAGKKGWTAVLVDGFPLGWGKQVGTQLKNHYPKGLRRTSH